MGLPENILKSFSLFVDGRGFAGEVTEFNPPALTIKSEEFRAGGMDAPIDLDMGMEKLECSFVTPRHCKDTLALFGVTVSGGSVPLTARGSVENYDGSVQAVKITMQGKIMKIEPGAWQPGGIANHTYTVSLTYYKYEQDGTVIHEIDVPNMVRKINGTDLLEQRRAALGL